MIHIYAASCSYSKWPGKNRGCQVETTWDHRAAGPTLDVHLTCIFQSFPLSGLEVLMTNVGSWSLQRSPPGSAQVCFSWGGTQTSSRNMPTWWGSYSGLGYGGADWFCKAGTCWDLLRDWDFKGDIVQGKPPSWALQGPRGGRAHGKGILVSMYSHTRVSIRFLVVDTRCTRFRERCHI